jgi:hypothetical protein
MGDYLLNKCRQAFFAIYAGITKQLRTTIEEDTIRFLLNCLKWRIGASDHEYIITSGIIGVLKDGNGDKRKEKNPIKFSWGHNIIYRTYKSDYSLSHDVIESLEFIMMS